ncbi:MAG: GatB/YqeY domain-containing protein [Patescibacteria group bacterium]
MSLYERIHDDLTGAMKTRREPERTVLRSVVAALKNAEIESGKPLDDTAVTAVLSRQLKQRQEAAEAAAARPEMAEQEQREAEVISCYLPEPLSDEALAELVDAAVVATGAAGPSDIGKVMGALKSKTAGRADQGTVAKLVKERLGA